MFIDIHTHTRKVSGFPRADGKTYATPEELIKRFDELGIERGVLLPGVNPECSRVPQSIENVLEISAGYNNRFIPFCNCDPRAVGNSPDAPLDEWLQFYKDKGCKGVGEICANLPFNNPMVQNLFRCCEKTKMPVTFHISPTIGGNYGLFDEPGLPQLEECLQAFPDVIFLGHSQAFWAEIGPLENADDRKGYPGGPVAAYGRVIDLMRAYPNLHGDLSANSGCNAISRDKNFGIDFLNEFQDRLYFGTDICSPDTPAPLAGYLLELKEEGSLSEEVFQKIARRNAIYLLNLDE